MNGLVIILGLLSVGFIGYGVKLHESKLAKRDAGTKKHGRTVIFMGLFLLLCTVIVSVIPSST